MHSQNNCKFKTAPFVVYCDRLLVRLVEAYTIELIGNQMNFDALITGLKRV